jgi:hypothetical protein
MVQTNVQTFSGDVEISSNVSMSSNVFIKGPGPTSNVVAIGIEAGYDTQAIDAVAIGTTAGRTDQGTNSVAIGRKAGSTSQGANSVAIGRTAAGTSQGASSVAVGQNSGTSSQGGNSVAIGNGAGLQSQGNGCVAIGFLAGSSSQHGDSVAIGLQAGESNQRTNSVAIGSFAGCCNQNASSVAVGINAGKSNQQSNATAVGQDSGKSQQGVGCVAVGVSAGNNSQGNNAVAIGNTAGFDDQGDNSVAIAIGAGYCNQGGNAIAIGTNCGRSNQAFGATCIGVGAGEINCAAYSVNVGYLAGYNITAAHTIILNGAGGVVNANAAGLWVRPFYLVNSGGGYNVRYDNTNGLMFGNTSDDRVKIDEAYITHGMKTILKLKPQTYYKKAGLDYENGIVGKESGLMAQDIYYDAPELRHLVVIPNKADPTPEKPPAPSDDPRDDPDYSAWGIEPTAYDETGILSYIIKSIQDLYYELPKSKTTVSNTWGQNITGLIVTADTNTHKTNTAPIVTLSNVYMDKRWYGVVSEHTPDPYDYDTLIDTKGDTRIWVTDLGGPLESGDLVVTSNVAPGHAQKQVDDLLRSSTVAKITQDCDFTTPAQIPIKKPRQELVDVTYYLRIIKSFIGYTEYKDIIPKFKETTTTQVYRRQGGTQINYYLDGTILIDKLEYDILPEDRRSFEECEEIDQTGYEKLSEEEKSVYTLINKTVYNRLDIYESISPHPKHTTEDVRQELQDVLDENGQIVWEDTDETKPIYTLIDNGSYKSALVSASLV